MCTTQFLKKFKFCQSTSYFYLNINEYVFYKFIVGMHNTYLRNNNKYFIT